MLQDKPKFFSDAARRVLSGALGTPPQVQRGLLAGTRVETPEGWQPVERLAAGDAVNGHDGQPRHVARVDRMRLEGRAAQDCLRQAALLPEGFPGSAGPAVVLAGQEILVLATRARALLGADYSVIAGKVLLGVAGIAAPEPGETVEIVMPVLDNEAGIWIGPGLLALCPGEAAADAASALAQYPVLDARSAEALIELLTRPAVGAVPSPFRVANASRPRRVKPRGGKRRGQAAAG